MPLTPIQNFDDAKAALDEEIKSTESMIRFYERDEKEAADRRARYSTMLYTLRDLRKRMDPPETPALTVVGQDAA